MSPNTASQQTGTNTLPQGARKTLKACALLGFSGVGLGAFAAHKLRYTLDESALEVFRTGAHYHLLHTLALGLVAVLQLHFPNDRKLPLAHNLFLGGTVVFSGSLYALAVSGIKVLGAITPIGGVMLLVAWAVLFFFAHKKT